MAIEGSCAAHRGLPSERERIAMAAERREATIASSEHAGDTVYQWHARSSTEDLEAARL
ncbi:MAG: hypothetical protein IT338_03165 [Thermomicrobiales bacterium]|nr:hypothetical protein [Thermomicrobiales bacterium]